MWQQCEEAQNILAAVPGAVEFVTSRCSNAPPPPPDGSGDLCEDMNDLVRATAGFGCGMSVQAVGCEYDTGAGPLSQYCPESCGLCGGPPPPPPPPPPPAIPGAERMEGTAGSGCMSARSCDQLQAATGEWPNGIYTPNICGESDAGFAGDEATCFGGGEDNSGTTGWQQAQAICFEAGARLCLVSELTLAVGISTGCGHNLAAVWAQDACMNGHMQNTFHAPIQSAVSEQHCESDDTNNAVRCCADGAAIRAGRAVCDQYASEQNACTSRLSCRDLRAASGQRSDWPTAKGDHSICGEADAGFECNEAATWAEAESTCLGVGARLCTVEELEADETKGTGCGNNNKLVWSEDAGRCGAGSHTVVVGSAASAAAHANRFATRCDADSTPHAVSCCGDSPQRVQAGVPCEAGGGGLAPGGGGGGSSNSGPRGPPAIMGSCVSARSCEQLRAQHGQWPQSEVRLNVCGESDAGFSSGCTGGQNGGESANWQQAQAVCFEVGARLCTPQEFAVGVAHGTGCSHNGDAIWTSEECPDGHTATTYMPGASVLEPQTHSDCLDDGGNAAVRCCADAESGRAGLRTCDLYGSEEGDCTSAMSCQELHAAYGGWSAAQMRQQGSDTICADSQHFTEGEPACFGGGEAGGVSWQYAQNVPTLLPCNLCSDPRLRAAKGCRAYLHWRRSSAVHCGGSRS